MFTAFFLIHCFTELVAQDITSLNKTFIKFSNSKLLLKDALDELDKLPEIIIVNNVSGDIKKMDIVFTSTSLDVQSAFNEISQQVPVEFIVNQNSIEVKNRSLQGSYLLQGIVKNAASGEPLITASVFIEGTTNGTITDNQGHYSLRLKPGKYTLVCSYMGFYEKRMAVFVFKNADLDILLEVKQINIDEVIVSGSSRPTEPFEKGRSIENIGEKIMSTLNTNDVNDALHGRLPGVWTTKVSGAPGDHNKIRIRGINSIFGTSDPLYVVDGMLIPVVNLKTMGISDLNSHDVQNLTVLKDAASTALYGYLGGNGVVLIDTKKGGGETRFNFSVKKGIQDFSKRYDLMDSKTFLSTIDSSDKYLRTIFLKSAPTSGVFPKYPHYIDSLGNALGSDNYQNELFRVGQLMEYQLSGQGNFKKIDYYISGNYYNHDGIITNSNYNKYTLTANFSKTVNEKLSLRFLYRGSKQENKNNLDNYLGNNVIFKGINFEPAFRYTPMINLATYTRLYFNPYDNQYTSSNEILQTYGQHNIITPESLFNEQLKKKTENTNSGNFVCNNKINNDFSAQASMSLSFRNNVFTSYLPYRPQYLQSNEGAITIDQQYDLKYNKQLKNHRINAFIRYRDHKDNTFWEIDSIIRTTDELAPLNDIYLRGSQAIYGEKGSIIRSIRSVIANANYNYKNKYFVSALANFDQLKEGHYVDRHDFFPSVALNWDISKESILTIPSWLNAFNIFINWGQAGNYPLNSLSNDLYTTDLKYLDNNGVAITNLANHYIVTEKVSETNYGTNISLFHERLKISANYYTKINSELLVQRKIPLYYGGGYFFDNIGEMRNKGIELSLDITPVSNKSFYWTSHASFSKNNQTLTKLNNGVPIKLSDKDVLIPDFILNEDVPLGSITGYSYHGPWNDLTVTEAESKLYTKHYDMAYLKGDTLIKWRLSDVNKTIIGNALPKFTFNWINRFEYKKFSCEMFWYGVIGCDKYNATKASTYITGINSEVRKIVMNKIKCITDQVFYESSYFIEDASFIRLKTLNFSYSPAKKIAKKVSVEYSLSLENLITLTHYSGYDPEASIYTDNNFTDNAIDKGAYPNPRGTYFSINLNF